MAFWKDALSSLRKAVSLAEVTQLRLDALQDEVITLKRDIKELYERDGKQGERIAALEAQSKDAEKRITLELENRFLRAQAADSRLLPSVRDGTAEPQ